MATIRAQGVDLSTTIVQAYDGGSGEVIASEPGVDKKLPTMLIISPTSSRNTARNASASFFKLKPLGLGDICTMLDNGLDPERIAKLIESRGVLFDLTSSSKSSIQTKGADDKLLSVIASSRKR